MYLYMCVQLTSWSSEGHAIRLNITLCLHQFVYPFTLEPHVIRLEDSRRSTLAAHTARREAYLKAREEEKERRKREALRRIAPGFEPQGTLLLPTKRQSIGVVPPPAPLDSQGTHGPGLSWRIS